MQCPQCGYLMSSFDDECPRCKNVGVTPPATTPNINPVSPNYADSVTPSSSPSLMGLAGIILICLGIIGACYFFLFFNTAVSTDFGYVNNIGLMGDKQNGILFGFGIAMIGFFLFFIDRSNPNKNPITTKQKKILMFSGVGLVAFFYF